MSRWSRGRLVGIISIGDVVKSRIGRAGEGPQRADGVHLRPLVGRPGNRGAGPRAYARGVIEVGASLGIVIVDHGSRRQEANRRHEEFVADGRPARASGPRASRPTWSWPSRPSARPSTPAWRPGPPPWSIAPYFLGPGNHWDRDIPALAAEARRAIPGSATWWPPRSARTPCWVTSWSSASTTVWPMPSGTGRTAIVSGRWRVPDDGWGWVAVVAAEPRRLVAANCGWLTAALNCTGQLQHG